MNDEPALEARQLPGYSLLPGWALATPDQLSDGSRNALAIGPFGSNLKVTDYQQSGVPLVFVRNIRADRFTGNDAKFVSEGKAAELAPHQVRQGDILITKMGDPPGDAAVYPLQTPGIITADCLKLTPHRGVNSKYLLWLIRSDVIRSQVLRLTKGVAQLKISLARFRDEVLLPLPPHAEQDRIVAAIEKHFSHLEAGVESLERARRNAARLKMAVSHQAISWAWPLRPLGEVATQLRNGLFVSRPSASPPGVPIFRISAVRPMALDQQDVRFAAMEPEVVRDYFVQNGDVLFTRYSGNRSYVGSCAVVRDLARETLHPDKLIRVQLDQSLVVPEFVALALNFGEGRRQIEQRLKTTAGQVGIAGGQLKGVVVPVPPLDVQRRVVHHVQAVVDHAEALAHRIQTSMGHGHALRRSLLQRAFSGHLVPQHPDDEPAATLLERIAAGTASPTQRSRPTPAGRRR